MTAIYRKTLQIHESSAPARLDKVLATMCLDVSRTQITSWIKQQNVTVDGEVKKPNFEVKGGEIVAICGTIEEKQGWESASTVPIEVLYEDSDVLVINKPAGLVVHPGAGTSEPTLANGLLDRSDSFRTMPRAGIVHRLDKDTSGVMVVAVNEKARIRLIRALAAHQVSRIYTAIVEGRLEASRTVNLPIARNPQNRTRQAVVRGGKEATTHLIPIQIFQVHTLIAAHLETGRTHQIRVHSANLGFPVVGDRKYGASRRVPPNSDPETIALLRSFPRQALHARTLRFRHPITADEMEFEAPLPDDMFRLIEVLEQDLKHSV